MKENFITKPVADAYSAPTVDVLDIRAERGFAQSPDGYDVFDRTEDTGFDDSSDYF